MRPINFSRRQWSLDALRLTFASGMFALVGCGGEREAPVVSNGKSREEMEKDIDNPYGAEIKNTIKKKKGAKAAQ